MFADIILWHAWMCLVLAVYLFLASTLSSWQWLVLLWHPSFNFPYLLEIYCSKSYDHFFSCKTVLWSSNLQIGHLVHGYIYKKILLTNIFLFASPKIITLVMVCSSLAWQLFFASSWNTWMPSKRTINYFVWRFHLDIAELTICNKQTSRKEGHHWLCIIWLYLEKVPLFPCFCCNSFQVDYQVYVAKVKISAW